MASRLLFTALASLALAAHASVLYQNDFEKEDLDKSPPSFLVLDGEFAVKQADGNKFLELPGAPLDAFGALFGPATNANIAVTARVFATSKGRRFPIFAVGLDGGTGFKLQVSPAKGALEIYKGDAAIASAPFQWKTGTWTALRLRVREGQGSWRIEGKAWPEGASEPAEWLVTAEEKTAPAAGRPSIWGSPVSGTPIRFDDIVLTTE